MTDNQESVISKITEKGRGKEIAIAVSLLTLIISGLQVWAALQNNRLIEAQTVEGFIPHLLDRDKKEVALVAMRFYVDREVVNSMASLVKSEVALTELAKTGTEEDKASSTNALNALNEERRNLVNNMFSTERTARISATTSLIRDWDHNIELFNEVIEIAVKSPNNKSGIINSLVLFQSFKPTVLLRFESELNEFFEQIKSNGPQTRSNIKLLQDKMNKTKSNL